MSQLTRWLPRLITGLGVVHVIYAVAESPGEIGGMATSGLLGAADTWRRHYVVWFLIGAFTLFMIGSMSRWAIRRAGAIPPHLGWWMLAIGVFDTVLEPYGGGYLVFALGALILYQARGAAPAPAAYPPELTEVQR
ncbi:MAG: DUF6463 family protein [Micromonosporaceae bacterium]